MCLFLRACRCVYNEWLNVPIYIHVYVNKNEIKLTKLFASSSSGVLKVGVMIRLFRKIFMDTEGL